MKKEDIIEIIKKVCEEKGIVYSNMKCIKSMHYSNATSTTLVEMEKIKKLN